MPPRHRPLRTIGARLTFWSASIILVVCALFCAAVYSGFSYLVHAEIDAFLEGEVRELAAHVKRSRESLGAVEAFIRRELGNRAQRDLAFRLYDESGRVVVSSVADEATDADRLPILRPLDPDDVRYDTLRPDGYRTCSIGLQTPEGGRYTAQVSFSLERLDASLATFRWFCAGALGLAAVLAIVSGRFLARRSLRPVQTVTETAQRIGATSLTERIPLAGTDDELDRLAATLNAMLDRIEGHVRRMQQFTADASHELRTPLAALRGSAEVALTRARTVEELRSVLEESIEHHDRLARIASDLLLLARSDAGAGGAAREPIDLGPAIAQVVDLYAPMAEERDVVLSLDRRDDVHLRADGTHLRQLAGNLIDNAIRYTEPGGHVDVVVARSNGSAELTIADDGAGIAPEHLPRVFDRFYRVSAARSAPSPGAGLGLSICRTIAEAHGGRIDIASTPGAGTRVVVTLPIGD